MRRRKMQRHNPVARSLLSADAKVRHSIVRSKKSYTRKGRRSPNITSEK